MERSIDIAIQLAEALHYLIQERIIHKDIKPSNILIHPETGKVKLIDFSISSSLPKERQQLANPNVLEGTLAYISPEQTGRTNRGIDYRTDFYSLGATLFELLTGQLPFSTSDPMELLHCHIARAVQFSADSKVPVALQEILKKLMAKNAEDRYQSALGLKYDLERCLEQLQGTGEIASFEIGSCDRSDRFLIPEKLYGRETEVQTLLDAFSRVAGGNTELMLVAGFSGIGKTAVVNEVHKPIIEKRGYFIKGKFDQFNRNIPSIAFVQAFRDLMGQLLGSSDGELATWKAKILEALGHRAKVLVEVIPELERIIGKQPPVPELSGSAAQNRFNLLFGKFIRVFTTIEHPLVIFLDDLQWADLASLNLLKLLMNQSEAGYLLVLGAYRDNEVSGAHPLILTLDEVAKGGAMVNTLTLAPLDEGNITRLVADTLLCSTDIAAPLSQSIYQKTRGNPFFTTQFLTGLHDDGFIEFETDALYWQWDLTRVRQFALADDVVAFIAGRLQKLPEATQELLKLAGCMGNRFDLATLAVAMEREQEEVAMDLWRALQEGFVVPESETYKFFQGSDRLPKHIQGVAVGYRFAHDRIQQAAYSLIPEDRKLSTHYRIGQLLLQKIPLEAREERIFEIVDRLNYGITLITQESDRIGLAQFNLIACRKARAATAYPAALEYASTGLLLLGENAWTRQYEISLALHDASAELASICGDFEAMEQFARTVVARSKSLVERVNVYRLKIFSNISQNKLAEAIAIAREFLQQLGVTFPDAPTQNDTQQALAEIGKSIGNREIEDLAYLPRMADLEKIAIVQIATSSISAAFLIGSPLFPLLVALSVKLSIQYGNTEASAMAYACYGIIACNMMQDVDTGVKFGKLALAAVSQLDAKEVEPEVLSAVGLFILHRKGGIQETLPLLQKGYATALEVGNLEYVGYNASEFCLHSFWCGLPLGTLERETRAYCNGLVQLNQLTTANYCRIYWQSILNLLGFAEDPGILSGEALKEAEFLPLLISASDFSGLYFFYLYKLMLCYLFGEIESAGSYGIEVRKYLMAGAGTVGEPGFYFYDSLSVLGALTSRSQQSLEAFPRVEQNQTQLQQHWARHAPENHQHKVDLVEAEKSRVLGQKAEAIELYDRAISGAKANEYLQEEALANELAAKFYLDWGKEKVASCYMQEAYYCYARWGAKAKTDRLEAEYPQLLAPILQQSELQANSSNFLTFTQAKGTIAAGTSVLDLTSAIKVSRAISEEISLDALFTKLMLVVLENAGADKGALILSNNSDSWEIVVQCLNDACDLCTTPLESSETLPTSVINTVKRTQRTLLVNDMEEDHNFMADPYLIQQQPKSVCCSPIVKQGRLIGILYLENHLTAGAFTPERLQLLNLLTAQAAISIENARLYDRLENYSQNLEVQVEERTQDLQEKNQYLQQTLQDLQRTQTQLIQSEKMSSLGQMVTGIAHEINNPINFIAGNIGPAREYFYDLLELLALYEENSPELSAVLREKVEEIDLEFLREDLEQLLDSMENGSDRISKIILGLRNFSRRDEGGMKRGDIRAGLENTLLMLQYRLDGGK